MIGGNGHVSAIVGINRKPFVFKQKEVDILRLLSFKIDCSSSKNLEFFFKLRLLPFFLRSQQ